MPWQRVRFLAVVGLGGAALCAVQYTAVLLALFAGPAALLCAVGAAVPLGVTVLAGIGTGGRRDLPYLRTRSGLWIWACVVYVGGSAATLALAALAHGPGRDPAPPALLAGSAVCFALSAASFLPGARARLAVLGATAVFAAAAGTAAWAAARPPGTGEWLASHHVDRGLLRLGTAPRGYALGQLAATSDGFSARYDHRGSTGGALLLTVRRVSYERERTAANGCPVPFGRRSVCADDGGGRQRVRYARPDARGVAVTPDGAVPPGATDELRLRRAGIVCIVSYGGGGAFDLNAARHVLMTLRPATGTELAGLRRAP
ncbi:hypothetical protein [Streptomyces sp. DW26H14]|uniref:hypothetical protein n=1 Tax=Streptomyces sp. DW26H14 TaxID=3435395 RepID=UPI00403D87E2